MKTPLGSELAFAYNLNSLFQIKDWADKACARLEKEMLDNTNTDDYQADILAFERLSRAIEKMITA